MTRADSVIAKAVDLARMKLPNLDPLQCLIPREASPRLLWQ